MTNFKTTKFISWIIFWSFVFLPFFAYSAPSPCGAHSRGHCVVLQSAAVSGTPILDQLGINLGRNIGDILLSLYQFGLGLVGVSALIMLVLGGVMYMTAGDSQNRLSRGKTFIGNAIFGLVLALLSWTLLYTINPDLVQKLELTLPREITRQQLLTLIPPGQEYDQVRTAVNSGAVSREQVETAVRTIGQVPQFRSRCAAGGGAEGRILGYQGGSTWVCQRPSDPEAQTNPNTNRPTCPAGELLYPGAGSPRCTRDFLDTNPNTPR